MPEELQDTTTAEATAPAAEQALPGPPESASQRRADRATRVRSARMRMIVGALVALALVLACMPFGWKAVVERLKATRKVDQAYALAKSADSAVIEMDTVIGATIETDTANRAAAIAKRLPGARADLEQVTALIGEAWPALNDDERKQSALLKEAVSARLAMIDAGTPLVKANEKAALALGPLRSGWDALLEAQRLSALAATQYNKLTKTSVQASDGYLAQVAEKLATAKADITEAGGAFSALDVAGYLSYVSQREKLLGLAKQSNAAFLKGDPAGANAISNQYNPLDKQAAAAAAKLPASPDRAVALAFDSVTSADNKTYQAARKRAEEADRKLKGK